LKTSNFNCLEEKRKRAKVKRKRRERKRRVKRRPISFQVLDGSKT
jgi:hypothetical protein